jgi:signal transduction histidine kinase
MRSWAETNLTARTGGNGGGPEETAPAPAATAAADPQQNGGSHGTAGNDAGEGARPGGRRSRRALKNWRVRSRLLLLIAIPTVAALVLGGFRVSSAVQSALAFQRAEQRAVLASDITQLAQRLETERDQTIYYIALGSQGRAGALSAPGVFAGMSAAGRQAAHAAAVAQFGVIRAFYRQTDQSAALFRAQLAQFHGAFSGVADQEVSSAVFGLGMLGFLRQGSTGTQLSSLVVVQKYAALIGSLLVINEQAAQGTGDPVLSQTVQALGLVSRMKEEASQQRAILSAALLAGNLSPAQAAALSTAQANQQSGQQAFNLSATPAQRAQFNNTVSGSFVYLAASQEQQAQALQIQSGSLATDTISANGFYDAMSSGIDEMGAVEQSLVTSIVTRANALRASAVTYAILVGLAVFVLFTLALICTVIVGRSMVRPLRRLRAGALEVAGVRLPQTVRRIDEGEGAGVPLHVEPIDVDSTDEIGEVARAFDQVHREAVRLAANEAALRGNVNAMFVNLSRRSQSLVERQIRLIDDLEQGEQDSERLANLFQMDHLATRMRRNSENLLVLAGHDVSRRWTGSVGLVDVLRAAVSEIEQYERVTLNVQPGIAVRGQAVNDVVHLLAELAENATSFSAAETPVAVSGHLLNSGGVLLDITDQGVGMGAEEMAHANWRLDNPPVVDVAVSRRMGLFVVARLAGRHGIRVRLRPASHGGLTALVWLPDEVITYEQTAVPAGLRRFETAPGAESVPNSLASLAEWPEPGQPEDRTAAMEAVNAARTPKFAPLRPDIGDTAAFPAADAETSSVPAADVDAGRVPAADAAAFPVDADAGSVPAADADAGTVPAADAAASSDTIVGAPSMPGLQPDELPSFSATVVGGDDGPAVDHSLDSLRAPTFGTEVSLTEQHGLTVPPPASLGEEQRLPIFESVESDWFRRGRHGSDHPTRAGTGAARAASGEWTSPADAGWEAAEVAHAPVSGGVTVAGLPKRVPQANLVPGAVGSGNSSTSPAPARSAAQTRERLANFQRGVREGRAAAQDNEATGGDGDNALYDALCAA